MTTNTAADVAGLFPVFDEAALATLRNYGTVRHVALDETLFAPGDPHLSFHVMIDATVSVTDNDRHGEHSVVATHGPGQFVGDTDVLNAKPATLTCSVTAEGDVLEIPADRLHDLLGCEPAISEAIIRALLLRHTALVQMGVGVRLIGSRYDEASRELLRFLSLNRVAVAWLDVERDAEAERALRQFRVSTRDIPLVAIGDHLLRRPSRQEVADLLGLSISNGSKSNKSCDLVVVGGGPAGLAAAVYGASEGLATILLEGRAIGGQAGTSSRIENYLGFPAGLSGEELATRALLQAQKFGVDIMAQRRAVALTSEAGAHELTLDDGSTLHADAVIIATGADYRRLPLDRLEQFEGAGVYYAATAFEASFCETQPVAVVGGGNSAGQACLFLAAQCRRVHLFIRRKSLDETMSRYLTDQIDDHPNITVHSRTEVVELIGDQPLSAISGRDMDSGGVTQLDVVALFVFIGAKPCTDWLGGQLAEENGFLLTGGDVLGDHRHNGQLPLPLETSRPGIFCAGDARANSVKRVASAVGEGSMAVHLVHERLARARRS